jgi:hypothetical protein
LGNYPRNRLIPENTPTTLHPGAGKAAYIASWQDVGDLSLDLTAGVLADANVLTGAVYAPARPVGIPFLEDHGITGHEASVVLPDLERLEAGPGGNEPPGPGFQVVELRGRTNGEMRGNGDRRRRRGSGYLVFVESGGLGMIGTGQETGIGRFPVSLGRCRGQFLEADDTARTVAWFVWVQCATSFSALAAIG